MRRIQMSRMAMERESLWLVRHCVEHKSLIVLSESSNQIERLHVYPSLIQSDSYSGVLLRLVRTKTHQTMLKCLGKNVVRLKLKGHFVLHLSPLHCFAILIT